MKKKLKFLVLLSSIFFVYIIYIQNNDKVINYIALGDSITLGENSYGAIVYSYSDYLKDYYKDHNKIVLYTKDYASKDKTIKDVYNDILLNKEVIIDGKIYSIKRLLREADIITISIGINDIIFDYNIGQNKYNLENKTIDKVFNNYKDLMSEIKKYYHKKIYVIGYYERDFKYDNLIRKYNKKCKKYADFNNDIFISTNFVEKNKSNFNILDSYYPKDAVYKEIFTKIVEKIN